MKKNVYKIISTGMLTALPLAAVVSCGSTPSHKTTPKLSFVDSKDVRRRCFWVLEEVPYRVCSLVRWS